MCNDSMNAFGQTPSSAQISGTTQTASGKCCWCEDFRKVVSVDALSKYYSDRATPPGRHRSRKQYQIDIKLKSLEAIILVTARLVNVSGVDDATINSLKKSWKSSSETQWNQRKYRLRVIDPECGTSDLKILHIFRWEEAGNHIDVRCQTGAVRANVQDTTMQVGTATSGWTFAHEVGHVIGLPDEYTDAGGRTVSYRKPDGTLGPGIKKRVDGVDSTSGANIMSAHGAIIVEDRHFWPLAIEAQELLRETLGRNVKCEIV